MEIKISQSKFKKVIFNYLDSIDELKYAEGFRNYSGISNQVMEYFYTYNDEEDMNPDFEFIFAYYNSIEAHENITGFRVSHVSSKYPLIELDSYFYNKLISLFGDTHAPKLILEWLNDIYGLNAINLVEH
jgi:ribosomal 30S subunit maturation factor RimM